MYKDRGLSFQVHETLYYMELNIEIPKATAYRATLNYDVRQLELQEREFYERQAEKEQEIHTDKNLATEACDELLG